MRADADPANSYGTRRTVATAAPNGDFDRLQLILDCDTDNNDDDGANDDNGASRVNKKKSRSTTVAAQPTNGNYLCIMLGLTKIVGPKNVLNRLK